MNNRRTAPGGQMTHMLSTILAKVTNIEKLLTPAIHNLSDSEIVYSKGMRLLTKMSDRTLLRRRNDGSLPFHFRVPSAFLSFRNAIANNENSFLSEV